MKSDLQKAWISNGRISDPHYIAHVSYAVKLLDGSDFKCDLNAGQWSLDELLLLNIQLNPDMGCPVFGSLLFNAFCRPQSIKQRIECI